MKSFEQYKDEEQAHDAFLKSFNKIVSKRPPANNMADYANNLLGSVAGLTSAGSGKGSSQK